MKTSHVLATVLLAVGILGLAAAFGQPLSLDVLSSPELGGAMLLANGPAGAAIHEIKRLIEAQGDAWVEYKEQVSANLGGLRSDIDALNERVAGYRITGGAANLPRDRQKTNEALRAYLRTGNVEALKDLAVHAGMSVGSDPDGGWTVFPTVSRDIYKTARDISPLRRLAKIELVSQGDAFEQLISTGGAGASWVGETSARPATTSPTLKAIHIALHEIYANCPVTQRLLDDSSYDIGGFVTEEIGTTFGEDESTAFVTGDGIAKPRGITTYTTVATGDATRAWGEIQYVPSGAAGGFDDDSPQIVDPSDCLIDALTALRPAYRRNSTWLMNSNTAATIRKFRDADGRRIWVDSLSAEQPSQLLGRPVELDEFMPDISANSLSIAIADWQRAYIIADRPALKLIQDPYTNKPNVMFYVYRRVGGGLRDSRAIKFVKFAAS